MTAVEGLEFIPKSYKTVRYEGTDGVETLKTYNNPRAITIAGDIERSGLSSFEYQKAIGVLDRSGTVTISQAGSVRRIGAKCTEFIETGRNPGYILYCVQFLCDSPYFESGTAVDVPVFKVIPKLDRDFTFPGEFSRRITRSDIDSLGTHEAEPIFTIIPGECDGVSIKNHTSGECLNINCPVSAGDVITVDLKSRRIYNSRGENLLYCLADDSFFEGFHLLCGINDIEVTCVGEAEGVIVSCRWYPTYSEAVIAC